MLVILYFYDMLNSQEKIRELCESVINKTDYYIVNDHSKSMTSIRIKDSVIEFTVSRFGSNCEFSLVINTSLIDIFFSILRYSYN